MKHLKLIISVVVFSLLVGCGYTSGVRSPDKVAFLYFSDEARDAEVVIDGQPAFTITKTGEKNLYQVTPGKHLIVIIKNDKEVVRREILLGDGQEKELRVPSSEVKK